jgi:hypothetical protein
MTESDDDVMDELFSLSHRWGARYAIETRHAAMKQLCHGAATRLGVIDFFCGKMLHFTFASSHASKAT